MRQSETNQLGAIGAKAVMHACTKLGWGVVESPTEFDVGTDLLIMVNDSGLFSLGVVMGAQVKTGKSFFDRPKRDATGKVVGWWFVDRDDEHSEYWLTHALPHLLILHDEQTERSYWVLLTEEAVLSTGKGRKVLVPAENLLDRDHLEELVEIAHASRPRPDWEGSAWAAADRVPSGDLLRHALLVPRLVAPNPNNSQEQEIGPEQALAMLVETRLADLAAGAGPFQNLPAPETWATSPDWLWQFAGAFYRRVTEGDVAPVLALVDSAPDASTRSAVLAASAAALLDIAQPDRALEMLAGEVDAESHSVDHAWLLVQYTRACIEVGRIDDARRAAARAVNVRRWANADVTASAISGTAAELLFRLSDWKKDDLRKMVAGQDTVAVWWRFQRLAAGASDVISQQFTAWTGRRAIVLFRIDNATLRLFTASILASHLGDHGAAGSFAALNAEQLLLRCDRHSDPQDVADLLTELRLSGADKSLGHAIGRVLDDGPADAVTLATAMIDFDNWTRSTCGATLTMLRRGGDVLRVETASRAVDWLLKTLDEPTMFTDRVTPRFRVRPRLVETLSGVITAAKNDDHERVADIVLSLPPQQDELNADAWCMVVKALPSTVWTPERAERARMVVANHHQNLRLALLGVVALVDQEARLELRDSLPHAGLAVVNELGPIWKDLTDDEIITLRDDAVGVVQRQVIDAKAFSSSLYEYDYAQVLVLLNLRHPHLSRWDPVYDLLEESMVAGADKVGVYRALSNHAGQLPADVHDRVLTIARSNLDGQQSPLDDLPDLQDPHSANVRLVATLSQDPTERAAALMVLLNGDDTHRAHAVSIAQQLPHPTAIGALAMLTRDIHPQVRALAASALLRLVVEEPADPLALEAITAAAHDPGTRVAQRISETLKHMTDLPPVLENLVSILGAHTSAYVRLRASNFPAFRR